VNGRVFLPFAFRVLADVRGVAHLGDEGIQDFLNKPRLPLKNILILRGLLVPMGMKGS